MRSLTIGGDASAIGEALLAIAVVGAVSMTLCFGALRARVKQG
jgi:hypothetical protein